MKIIIKLFIGPYEKLFKGIEMIVQAFVFSRVKHSCESVLDESLNTRIILMQGEILLKEASEQEFEIVVNGPLFAGSDGIG